MSTNIPKTTEWLSDPKLAARYDTTVRTIVRWQDADPEFPRPVWFGPRRKRTSREALDEYDRMRAAQAAEQAALAGAAHVAARKARAAPGSGRKRKR
jgi:hypothetical protein